MLNEFCRCQSSEPIRPAAPSRSRLTPIFHAVGQMKYLLCVLSPPVFRSAQNLTEESRPRKLTAPYEGEHSRAMQRTNTDAGFHGTVNRSSGQLDRRG